MINFWGIKRVSVVSMYFPPPPMDAFYSYRYLDGADGTNTDDEDHVDTVFRRRPPHRRGRNRRRNHHTSLSSRDQVMAVTYV